MPFLSKYIYTREKCICISVKLRIYATKEALISHFSFREKERDRAGDYCKTIYIIVMIIESSFFSTTYNCFISHHAFLSTKENEKQNCDERHTA